MIAVFTSALRQDTPEIYQRIHTTLKLQGAQSKMIDGGLMESVLRKFKTTFLPDMLVTRDGYPVDEQIHTGFFDGAKWEFLGSYHGKKLILVAADYESFPLQCLSQPLLDTLYKDNYYNQPNPFKDGTSSTASEVSAKMQWGASVIKPELMAKMQELQKEYGKTLVDNIFKDVNDIPMPPVRAWEEELYGKNEGGPIAAIKRAFGGIKKKKPSGPEYGGGV